MAIEFKNGQVIRTGADEYAYSYDELFDTGPLTSQSNTDDFRENPIVVMKAENVADYLNKQRGMGDFLLDSAGSFNTDDINETMRDFQNRLETKITAINNLQDAPQDVKEDLDFLLKSWEQVSPEGARQWATSIYDNVTDFVFNPETLLSIGAGVTTLGTGAIATKTASIAAKRQATKKLYSMLQATTAAAVNNPYKSASLISGLYGGGDELLRQDLFETLGTGEGRNWEDVAKITGISAAFGPILVGGFSLAGKGIRKLKTQTDKPQPFRIERVEEDAENFEGVKQLDLFEPDVDEKILAAIDTPRIDTDAPEGTQGELFDFDESNPQDPVVQAVSKFVSDLGGGERSRKEILSEIRNAAKNEPTRKGKRKAIQQSLFNMAASLTSNFYGKTAGILTPLVSLSGTARQLQKKLHHEFAEEYQPLTPQQTVIEKDLFEVQREITGRYNETFRQIVEELSLSNFSTKFADEVNDALSKSLRSPTPIKHANFDDSVNKAINRAAAEIREMYSDMGTRLQKIKVINEMTDNYVPRMWSRSAIEANPEKLAKLFVDKAGMTPAGAQRTVKNMLDLDNQIDSGNGSGYFFSAKRKINTIGNDSDFEEFLNSDVLTTFHAYTFQAGKSLAKHRVLGVNNFKDFEKFYIARIKKEVEGKGEKFTNNMYANLEKLYRTQTGEGLERYGRKVQTAADAYSLVNRVAYLGLATVSSLTEIMLNLSKAGFVNSVKGLGDALSMSHKRITKDLETKLQNQHGLTAKEAFAEMRNFSIYIEQEMGQLGDRLTGDALINETMQKASNKFFRLNFLDQWTKFVQNVSYRSGKNMIQSNIEFLAKFGNRELDSLGKRKAGELAELGIDYKDAVKWYKSGAKVEDDFYKNSYLAGAARYTNSVILQPTGLAGNKPFLMANPKTSILFQLLSYPAAFSNTVLKGMAKGAIKDPRGRLFGKIIPAAAIMTGMARYTNYLRTNGESERNKDTDEIIYDSIARWGGNGLLLDSLNRARTSAKYTRNSASYLAMPLGPLGSDAMSLYQQGVIPTLGTKVPVLSGSYFGKNILGDWRVKQYRRGLREKQEKLTDFLIPEFDVEATAPGATRTGYKLGGEVAGTLVDFLGRKAKSADEFTDELSRPLANSTDNIMSNEEVERLSRQIESGVYEIVQNPADETDAIALAEALVVNSIKNRNLKITDVESKPKLKAALAATDYDDALVKFAEARDELSVDEDHYQALEFIQHNKERIDPTGQLNKLVSDVSATFKNNYKLLKIDLDEDELSKASLANFDKDTIDLLHDFVESRLKHKGGEFFGGIISDVGATKVAKNALLKIAARGNVDLTKFKPPRKLTPEDSFDVTLTDAQRDSKIETFLKDSQVKRRIFRAKRFFSDVSYFMSFGMPRELGAHLGTKGAADNIKLRDMLFDYFDSGQAADLYAVKKNQLTQEEYDSMLNAIVTAVESKGNKVNLDNYIIEEGVVNIKKPLLYKPFDDEMENVAGTWDAVEIFMEEDGAREFLTNLKASGTKISSETIDEIEKFMAKAYEIKTHVRETALDKIEYELMRIELNIDVQNMLKGFGYDGIKYQNKLEKSYINDDDFSYIAFDPQQFKSIEAVAFDPNDPRHRFSAGGKAAKQLASYFAPKQASGFFSLAAKEASKIKDNVNTGEVMLKRLEGKVSQEELEWTGANSYFKDKPKVTREEVVDFFENSGFDYDVYVGRVPKRADDESPEFRNEATDDIPTDPQAEDMFNSGIDEDFERFMTANYPFQLNLMDDLAVDSPAEYDKLLNDFFDEYVERYVHGKDFKAQPHHMDFSFEGQDTENYREVVLALKDKFKKLQKDYVHSGHFPSIKNPLLHIRLADITPTENLRRTLLIDELQSDKSQAATGKRGAGYAKSDAEYYAGNTEEDLETLGFQIDRFSDEIEDLEDILENMTAEELQSPRADRIRKEIQYFERVREAVHTQYLELSQTFEDMGSKRRLVPNLPLKDEKKWALVGLKQAMMIAAKEGYEQLALTTGRIQKLRNNKLKEHNGVGFYYEPNSGEYVFEGYTNFKTRPEDGMDTPFVQKTTHTEIFDSKEEFETFVNKSLGKEKAEKLLNAEPNAKGVQRLEEDIEVNYGGQKFDDFYNKTLIKLLNNNFGKKYGVEIEDVEYQRWDGTVKLPTIKITPKMREDILKGLAMFSEGGYVIKRGDTLTKIAEEQGMTIQEIAEINDIKDVDLIYAGDILKLEKPQGTGTVQQAEAVQEAEPIVAPTPEVKIEQVEYDTKPSELYESVSNTLSGAVGKVTDTVSESATKTGSILKKLLTMDFGSRGRTAENMTGATGQPKISETPEPVVERTEPKKTLRERLAAIRLPSFGGQGRTAENMSGALRQEESDLSGFKNFVDGVLSADFSSEGRTAENTAGTTGDTGGLEQIGEIADTVAEKTSEFVDTAKEASMKGMIFVGNVGGSIAQKTGELVDTVKEEITTLKDETLPPILRETKRKLRAGVNILPENAVQFTRYMLGNKLGLDMEVPDVRVEGFGTKQQDVLKTAIENAKARGSTSVQYRDYPLMRNGTAPSEFYKGKREDQDLVDLALTSMVDPSFEMFTTIGAFNFKDLGDGKYQVLPDKYDFDSAKSDRTKDAKDKYGELVHAAQDVSDDPEKRFTFNISGVLM